MNIIIRQGVLADLEVIVRFNIALALESEGLQLDPTVVLPGVEAVFSDPSRGTFFVAEQEEKVVGQLLITREWSDWRNGEFWWVQSVYVHPDFRSRGIFKALYRHIQETARAQKNIRGFRLYMEKNNAARKVYEGLGMKQTYYEVFEEAFK